MAQPSSSMKGKKKKSSGGKGSSSASTAATASTTAATIVDERTTAQDSATAAKKRLPPQTCPSSHHGSIPTNEDVARFRTLTQPHVDSFNYMLSHGIAAGIADLEPTELDLVDPATNASASTTTPQQQREELQNVSTIRVWIENVRVQQPVKSNVECGRSIRLTPRECRERHVAYTGKIVGTVCCSLVAHRNGRAIVQKKPMRIQGVNFGQLPIMVMSTACHLSQMSVQQLIRNREECYESGGYFIVGGIERCVRLLQIPKRNHPTSITRSNYKNRGPTYTDKGVAIRATRYNNDGSSITNTVHYLSTGCITLRFIVRKQEFLIPIILILRALSGGDVTAGGSGDDGAAAAAATTITDEELYRRIVQGDVNNTFLVARAHLLLQDARAKFPHLNTATQCLAYIGSRFRSISQKAPSTSDLEVGHYMIRKFILIHCRKYHDKLECCLLLIRKLYSFIAGQSGEDNADSLQNQEILLPGHLLSAFVKEKFEECLQSMRVGLIMEMRKDYPRVVSKINASDKRFWTRIVDRYTGSSSSGGGVIGKKVHFFLATGTIVSTSGLDLMQVSGYTIVAERLNFLRYCAHFRSVHRGQFFMEMKTTAVRKLLPDQWGFLCPVHTPDGGPCGLLSHLSIKSSIITHPTLPDDGRRQQRLEQLLYILGVIPTGYSTAAGHNNNNNNSNGRIVASYTYIPVCIDGRVIGSCLSQTQARSIASRLRQYKVQQKNSGVSDSGDEDLRRDDYNDDDQSNEAVVPRTLEVVLVPVSENPGTPYPGLFLFSGLARIVRPVSQLSGEHDDYGRHEAGATDQEVRQVQNVEFIGPMEQNFLDIACLESDIRPGETTHYELDPTNMLSLIANLTPFSDQNQSPRNMYQCQMGKQTMGTPTLSLPYRPDNKLYKLQTPQAPIVQTSTHSRFMMDEYPNGTNAVVAVLSYTGFDMEDAMILNKSAYERGLAHASVYKTVHVDLQNQAKFVGGSSNADDVRLRFGNKVKTPGTPGKDTEPEYVHANLQPDGLPRVGDRVKEGQPLYCIVDSVTGTDNIAKHKDKEHAYVQAVRMIGNESAKSGPTSADDNKLSLTLRFPRNPVIGDKFSSRHGQKGVLSILWPQTDMPFSESGMSPDIIINPHAFPSRMTIGMLVESMAGKAGSLYGQYQDSTPFTFHDNTDDDDHSDGQQQQSSSNRSIDYFGQQLQSVGYNYYGSETLYSGVSGCMMQADLYIGLVYYQRLRHMVSDKYQVRATGPTNELTRQPIKGRKKGGGIRLGEMERDSLLSHGTAFLLHDRLVHCSDEHVAYVCCRCGDLLMPVTERNLIQTTGQSMSEAIHKPKLRLYCRNPSCVKTLMNSHDQASPTGDHDMIDDQYRNDEAVVPVTLPYVYRYLTNELAGMNIKMKLSVR